MVMKSIDIIISYFEKNIIAQSECIKNGDHQNSNKHGKKYIKAFEEIRKRGDEAREKLSWLLTHEREDVQVMTAAYLLRFKTAASMAVLQRISKEDIGLVSFEAGEAIKRWNEDNWSLDP